MSAIAMADTASHRQDFEHLLVQRCEPPALVELRRQALQRFCELGIPSPRQENWRFTDVSALAERPLRRATETLVDVKALPELGVPNHRLVFVNGRFAPILSRLDGLPDQVVIASLAKAATTHQELLQSHLQQSPGLAEHPFAALNGAFWEDGALIYLPRGTYLEQPLHLVFYANGDATVNYPRVLLILEQHSQASVIEEYRGEGHYLSCPVTQVRLDHGSHLTFYKLQEDSFLEAWHLGCLDIYQAPTSQLQLHSFCTGGILARTDISVELDGAQAECDLNGLVLAQCGQLSDHHVRVEHTKPGAHSQQLFKAILEGKSQSVFDGLIQVHRQAQKTVAMQNSRNLLLSRQALAHSNPRLEILADDVKCSHGSSTGFLDPQAMFYLRSRGLSNDQAQAMLVYGFANDSIERISIAPLRERLEQLLTERLYTGALEGQRS